MKINRLVTPLKLIAVFVGVSWGSIGFAQSGIYLTAESGWASQNKMPATIQKQAAQIQHLPVVRLGVGYLHDLNARFGVGLEVAGGWYRGAAYELEQGRVNAYSSTAEFLAVFVLHADPVDCFAKIGGIRHTLNDFSVIINDRKASETKIQPEVAVGLSYHLNQRWALVAEYVHSFGSKIENFQSNSLVCPGIRAALIGLKVTFG